MMVIAGKSLKQMGIQIIFNGEASGLLGIFRVSGSSIFKRSAAGPGTSDWETATGPKKGPGGGTGIENFAKSWSS